MIKTYNSTKLLQTMKKLFFTLAFNLFLLCLKAGSDITIFDPADPKDSATAVSQGFSIVTLDGVKYLKMLSQVWGPTLMLNDTITLSKGSSYSFNVITFQAKLLVGPTDTFGNSRININAYLYSIQNSNYRVSGTSSSIFSTYSDESDNSYAINQIWFFCQENVTWTSVAGDTLYVGKITTNKYTPPEATPTKIKKINKIDHEIDITGSTDDNWAPATADSVKNKVLSSNGHPSSDADNSATFKALWTNDNLYLNVNVKDNDPIKFTGASPWYNDGIELFFDIGGHHFYGYRLDAQPQIRINYGTDSISGSVMGTKEYGCTGIENGLISCKQSEITGGYNLLIKIPWYVLYYTSSSDTALSTSLAYKDSTAKRIASGNEISFELALKDNSTSIVATLGSILDWANNTGIDSAYLASSVWGSLQLTAGNKSIPVITWANPSDINYGTALTKTQLNATANVDGVFVYSPANGTILNAGHGQTLDVTFTPTDTSDYSSTTKETTINVLKYSPVITWAVPADITYGTVLSNEQLNATTDVAGALVYSPIEGTTLTAGNGQTLNATFTPTDTANYSSTTKKVSINVLKSTPVITWITPADITYGTALSNTQLNATADIAGDFVYSPASGTKLDVGDSQKLSVTFTPNDADNNYVVEKAVLINVLSQTDVLQIVESNITLYPNPTSGKVYVRIPQNILSSTISIYTIDGDQVLQTKTFSALTELDIENLPSGIYIVKIVTNDKSLVIKILKQ
jgi:hypothetical protein